MGIIKKTVKKVKKEKTERNTNYDYTDSKGKLVKRSPPKRKH